MLGSFGLPELAVALLLVILVLASRRFRGSTGSTGSTVPVVLRRFHIADSTEAELLIDIAGRTGGLLGWLLTALGLEPGTSLKVTQREIAFKTSTISGETYQLTSLARIASAHCGYTKKTWLLLVASAVFVVSAVAYWYNQAQTAFQLLLVAVVIVALYAFSKRVTLAVETTGGLVLGLSFKRGVIENTPIDEKQALRAIALLNRKVVEQSGPSVIQQEVAGTESGSPATRRGELSLKEQAEKLRRGQKF